jgi:arginyl-tRNA--protein-N-Asp/Glu arginylyltransferase
MAYKARFRPAEILAGGGWRRLTEADLVAGPPARAALRETVA